MFQTFFGESAHKSIEAQIKHNNAVREFFIDVAEKVEKEVRNVMEFQRSFDEFVSGFHECIAEI